MYIPERILCTICGMADDMAAHDVVCSCFWFIISQDIFKKYLKYSDIGGEVWGFVV